MTNLSQSFLWGAATAPHQVEGNNLNSDWWSNEHLSQGGLQLSGDAVDSYHRYAEDMQILADAGLNAYRFGVEWARVEPVEGHFSRAELAHYRRMIETALKLGLTPVVTLHHFTVPRWFAEAGGWLADDATQRFCRYVEQVTAILDGVEWVCTINEPNVLALMTQYAQEMQQAGDLEPGSFVVPAPDPKIGARLASIHSEAARIVRGRTSAKVGWTIGLQALASTAGNETKHAELQYLWDDLYLEASRGDDFVGVQAYTSQAVGPDGVIPHPPSPDNTLTGWAYRPDALGIATRHAWDVTGGVPVLVTENGIATADDDRRIAYTRDALRGLFAAIDDGVDVRGYLHWSALDNYEWGHWEPTFGLIAVDRETFERHPKPSLGWLGDLARSRGAQLASRDWQQQPAARPTATTPQPTK
jgi:beta-glucosidase